MPRWITTAEAAKLTGYTLPHIRELLAAGRVAGRRFGVVWQVDSRSLLAYVREQSQKGEKRGRKKKT